MKVISDDAIFRRFVFILFPNKFEACAKQAQEKLYQRFRKGGDLQYVVFSWFIEGAIRYFEQNSIVTTLPGSIEIYLDNYRNKVDTILQFIDETIMIPDEQSKSNFVTLKLLYEEYEAYCTRNKLQTMGEAQFRSSVISHRWFTDNSIVYKDRHRWYYEKEGSKRRGDAAAFIGVTLRKFQSRS